jgi:lambda repressor-like predicted transcriptional regulator
MPGKSPTPEKIIDAVTLRAAGHTIASISDRTGISVRTLSRIFERHTAKKGEINAELVEAAKRDLIETVTSNDRIKEEAARLIADDIAHARLLRSRMADATEHMTATNLLEAALLMRAAAAYSTALKNTSDTLRHSLGTDRALETVEAENLPELVVREISDTAALQLTLKGQELMSRLGMGEKPADVA